MERKNNLEKSIALIGPKQVGKTFFAENLVEEKNAPNFILSSDLLTNLIVYNIAGKWIDLVLDTELKEIGETYKTIFDFKELSPIVASMAECMNGNSLTPKAKKVAMSYWKARLLEDASNMLKMPFILDVGADVGAIIELTASEKSAVSKNLFMPYDFIEARLSSFLKQFGTIIYLKPGKSYETISGRAKDNENAIYLESGNSYSPYATHIIDCDELYNTPNPKEETVKAAIKSLNLNKTPTSLGE